MLWLLSLFTPTQNNNTYDVNLSSLWHGNFQTYNGQMAKVNAFVTIIVCITLYPFINAVMHMALYTISNMNRNVWKVCEYDNFACVR